MKANIEGETLTISADVCAGICLQMLDEYEKQMSAPVYKVISFREWLKFQLGEPQQ